VGVCFY
jgi:serine/threonine protein kinase